ncbi:response regulator transcription factor [Streptomyces sp. NBC_00825]|uniref:helix-turn-helix transcriptional regulator n=1 Tax=unclassified Streptomyces TaxID=2593676 RepID=UPI002ED04271|nr:response regulator transcription factor [Streptomyces sp. NBC_00826]WTH89037.1 response regulator transcription factor [Streptomyces sp. NBC_00825]WTH97767.1 response regulator transcription factor [Streptomyces sp. NBC_00822]
MTSTVQRVSVTVHAGDPVPLAGIAAQLYSRPEVTVLNTRPSVDGAPEVPDAVVVVVDAVDEAVLTMLRHIQRTSTSRTVLVTTDIDEQKLVSAAECGVAGVVRRSEATPEHLVQVIGTVARGEGHLPSDLLGRLLEEVGRLQGQVLGPRGLHFTGLAAREVDVLRLVAEGYDTADIATKLAYSERTIKNVLHSVMTRLQLRNRSHAVAYAMRQGLI